MCVCIYMKKVRTGKPPRRRSGFFRYCCLRGETAALYLPGACFCFVFLLSLIRTQSCSRRTPYGISFRTVLYDSSNLQLHIVYVFSFKDAVAIIFASKLLSSSSVRTTSYLLPHSTCTYLTRGSLVTRRVGNSHVVADPTSKVSANSCRKHYG